MPAGARRRSRGHRRAPRCGRTGPGRFGGHPPRTGARPPEARGGHGTGCGCWSAGADRRGHAPPVRACRWLLRRGTCSWSTPRPTLPAAVARPGAWSCTSPPRSTTAAGWSNCGPRARAPRHGAPERRRRARRCRLPGGARLGAPAAEAARRRPTVAGAADHRVVRTCAGTARRSATPTSAATGRRRPTRPSSPPRRAAPRCRAPGGRSPRRCSPGLSGGACDRTADCTPGSPRREAHEPPYPERYAIPAGDGPAGRRDPGGGRPGGRGRHHGRAGAGDGGGGQGDGTDGSLRASAGGCTIWCTANPPGWSMGCSPACTIPRLTSVAAGGCGRGRAAAGLRRRRGAVLSLARVRRPGR